MFSIFKKSISATDIGEVLGEVLVNWPAKHGAEFKAEFADSFEAEAFPEVINEIVYFLGFGTDFAIYTTLKESPQIMAAVRAGFQQPFGRYVIEHECPPVIPGDWMEDTWIWMAQGIPPEERGNPLTNINNRFALYAAALKRATGREMSAGARAAHLLAGWCMSMDAAFLVYASSLFSHHIVSDRKVLLSVRITI